MIKTVGSILPFIECLYDACAKCSECERVLDHLKSSDDSPEVCWRCNGDTNV